MNISDYMIDPKTGYLTPKLTCTDPSFNADQKAMFLDTFAETANFSKAAKLVGVTRHLVNQHFEMDIAFYKSFRDTVDKLCDEVEGNLFKMAKKTPVAAFGFLKAYRKSVWGDGKQGGDASKANEKLKGLLEEIKKEEK